MDGYLQLQDPESMRDCESWTAGPAVACVLREGSAEFPVVFAE